MRISYDQEGDVLDVIFDERLHRAETEKAAYRLRDGFMLYVTVDFKKLIQLTVVNYRRLAQLPVLHFYGWQALQFFCVHVTSCATVFSARSANFFATLNDLMLYSCHTILRLARMLSPS